MKRRHTQILDRLARARLEIETAALQLADDEQQSEKGTIGRELLEVRARVDALEARVAVVEGKK